MVSYDPGDSDGNAVLAAVDTGSQQITLKELSRPTVPPDGALLRVQATGVYGADISVFRDATYAAASST